MPSDERVSSQMKLRHVLRKTARSSSNCGGKKCTMAFFSSVTCVESCSSQAYALCIFHRRKCVTSMHFSMGLELTCRVPLTLIIPSIFQALDPYPQFSMTRLRLLWHCRQAARKRDVLLLVVNINRGSSAAGSSLVPIPLLAISRNHGSSE